MADSVNTRLPRTAWTPRTVNRAILTAAVWGVAVSSLWIGWLPTLMATIPVLAVVLLACGSAALSRRWRPLGAVWWSVLSARLSAAAVLTLLATFTLERGRTALDKWHAERLALRLDTAGQTEAQVSPLGTPWWFRGKVHAEAGSERFTIEVPDRTSLTDIWVYDGQTRRWREE